MQQTSFCTHPELAPNPCDDCSRVDVRVTDCETFVRITPGAEYRRVVIEAGVVTVER